MSFWKAIKTAIEEIILKGSTIAGTVFMANNGMAYILPFVQGDATASLFIQGVVVLAGYKVWMEAIVPIITELFKTALPKTTQAGKSKFADRFALI